MPHSLDAERFCLGSIITNNSHFLTVAGAVTESDFFTDAHRQIFRAMKTLDDTGERIDYVILAQELIRLKQIEAVGGISYLVDLTTGLPNLPSVDGYVRVIQEKASLRRIAFAAQNTMNRALRAEEAPSDIMAGLENAMRAIGEVADSLHNWQTPGEAISTHPGGFNAIICPSKNGQGIKTPWNIVNQTLGGGMLPGDLVILAGRPGHGKSSAALQIAAPIAETMAVPYFSLEMSKSSLIRRLLGQVGQIDTGRMKSGHMNYDERRQVVEARTKLETLRLYLDDTRGRSTASMRRSLKRLAEKQEIGAIVVDHLHLITGAGREETRDRFNRIADDLMDMAFEFHCPLIALAQLNRKCEMDNRPPNISDLAESGKLEQNAQIVMFTHRAELYQANRDKAELRGLAEIIVAKNREGDTGKQDVYFVGSQQRFINGNQSDDRQEAA
jgi:replicative DNA helicase